MQFMRVVTVGIVVLVGACGGGGSGGETVAASAPAEQGPHAHAVTRQFSIEVGKLVVDEKTFSDGLAMRLEDGAGAILTEAPLSACAKLAAVAHGSLGFDATTFGDKPALVLVRNQEHPQGAILLIEKYSTTTLEEAFPSLVTEGDTLIAAGDVGDAGWGSIDATKYGGEKSPHVRLDVKLPYASLDSADPLAADASAEAKWLRESQTRAAGDIQAAVDASIEVDTEDYSGSVTSSAWFDVLANWKDFSVVALATDKDCATMVVRQPGFVGGYQQAIIRIRTVDGVRKVIAADTKSMDSIEGDYAFGRVEQSKLGGFPILHGRAAREEGVGLVVYLSDKPIAVEPFETLAGKQHMLRAVASSAYGNQYSFSYYELGGPGIPVEQIDAGSSTSNPSLDEKEIAGLIKLGEGDGPRIAVNFRLALAGHAR
jgi:hypothetical protein